MIRRILSCVLAAAVGAGACVDVSTDHFWATDLGGGGYGGQGGQGSGGDSLTFDSGGGGPPPADASGYCGNQIHQISLNPLTVYFIFDISGSMATPVGSGTRYSVVEAAAVQLVSGLRYVVKAGAAAFPLQAAENPCNPGDEVFPPALDDPIGFANAVSQLQPYGGTPTAATLLALAPKLAKLPGKVIAVLATDGGPNCNPNASCSISDCTENIEGCAPTDSCCAESVNCCAPGGPAGPIDCVDRDATVDAVSEVAATGVKVYVVGIPGSQYYADVLTSMAFAGAAELPSSPFYYDVQDLGTLATVFKTIAGAEVPCDITVDDPPSSQGDTNVYLDQMLVLYDPTNGWTWSASNVVTLHGTACEELQSGAVGQVQVVSGCPTQATQ